MVYSVYKPDRLRFGPAGIPNSTPGNTTIDGVIHTNKLGLDAMEMEFVRGVRLKEEAARKIGETAREVGILLTAHAPYYINLNSKETDKIEASIKRILDTAKITWIAGGYSITFHAAYYGGFMRNAVYKRVSELIRKIVGELKNTGVEIWVRPELTGKPTQFGDLDELIKLSQELEMVLPCVDFAHLHARYAGRYNSYEEIREVLIKIEDGLGREALDNMHIHISGIIYTRKGEKKHVNLEESDYNYLDLIKVWREFDIKGVVISESPNLEDDALMLKKLYYKSEINFSS